MAFGGILEKILLNESATPEQICKAIDNHSYVILNYHTKGEDKNTGSRIVMPVAYGLTSASNPVVRAYQPFGDSTTKARQWKYFRLDRISYWEETKKTFTENDLPSVEMNVGILNKEGDKSMKIVNKVISFDKKIDASSDGHLGPKTTHTTTPSTTDIRNMSTLERLRYLHQKNKENQDVNIKIDLDNNRKANSTFNAYTNNTPVSAGPREPDQSYQPRNVSGKPSPQVIDSNELDVLRNKINNIDNTQTNINPFTDYSHQWDSQDVNNYDREINKMNRQPYQNQDLSISKRKYDRYKNSLDSADKMFKNRKASGNRWLYNLDDLKKDLEKQK